MTYFQVVGITLNVAVLLFLWYRMYVAATIAANVNTLKPILVGASERLKFSQLLKSYVVTFLVSMVQRQGDLRIGLGVIDWNGSWNTVYAMDSKCGDPKPLLYVAQTLKRQEVCSLTYRDMRVVVDRNYRSEGEPVVHMSAMADDGNTPTSLEPMLILLLSLFRRDVHLHTNIPDVDMYLTCDWMSKGNYVFRIEEAVREKR